MPASFLGPGVLAPTGTTGNVTLPAGVGYQIDPSAVVTAVQIVTEIAGTTCTYTVQGSLDGVNWYPLAYLTDASDTVAVAAVTRTTLGTSVLFLSQPLSRRYKYYRVVSSANTGQTFRVEIYNNNPN
jgi:hypothetical protein